MMPSIVEKAFATPFLAPIRRALEHKPPVPGDRMAIELAALVRRCEPRDLAQAVAKLATPEARLALEAMAEAGKGQAPTAAIEALAGAARSTLGRQRAALDVIRTVSDGHVAALSRLVPTTTKEGQVALQGIQLALKQPAQPTIASLGKAYMAFTALPGATPELQAAWADAYLPALRALADVPGVHPLLAPVLERADASLGRKEAVIAAATAIATAPPQKAGQAALDTLARRAVQVGTPVDDDLLAQLAELAARGTVGDRRGPGARKLVAAREALGTRPTQVARPAVPLLDKDLDGQVSAKELVAGLVHGRVAVTRDGVAPVVGAIAPDPAVMPSSASKYFKDGQGNPTVEQCMEFVLRYFREHDVATLEAAFKVQHDLGPELEGLADGRLKLAGISADLNAGRVPPRPGDVLAARGPGGFHVAIVVGISRKGGGFEAEVFQANVPLFTNASNLADHLEKLPLRFQDGRWSIPPLQTSKQGYPGDMAVVGWLRPEPGLRPADQQVPLDVVQQAIAVVDRALHSGLAGQ